MDKLRAFLAPNRVVVYLTGLAALATAVAAVWGDLDWTSTAGVAAALVTLLGVVVKWLDGWQKYEARDHDSLQAVETADVEPRERTDVPAEKALVG